MKEAPAVRLRRAGAADADMILRWRNDPWIVSLGKGGRTVGAEEHAAWFARVLADPERHLLLVVRRQDADIGLIRLDRLERERALVTIYLMQPHTGRGYGGAALREAVGAGFSAWPGVRSLEAEVLADNEPSLRMFARCGFTERQDRAPGGELVRFRLDRDAWKARP